jgi:hypothetical protein
MIVWKTVASRIATLIKLGELNNKLGELNEYDSTYCSNRDSNLFMNRKIHYQYKYKFDN